jgi:hypothetical protein
MQPEAGHIHVPDMLRSVEARENDCDLLNLLRRQPPSIVVLERAPEPTVAEAAGVDPSTLERLGSGLSRDSAFIRPNRCAKLAVPEIDQSAVGSASVMAAAWLTYSWADNRDHDVDYIAQELTRAGLTVRLDRWDLQAGRRLWEQIGNFISDPCGVDAWIIYATANSLGSEKCKEELYYAVDRALATRTESFPVVALFQSVAEIDLLPPALKTRLNVSLEDPQWTERIVAAAEGRQSSIDRPEIGPYAIAFHRSSSRYFVEIRPRAGVVSSFFAAIPVDERDAVGRSIVPGPSGRIPSACMVMGPQEFRRETEDGAWWVMTACNQATPSTSYFLQCRELPSRIAFGELGSRRYIWRKPGARTSE